MTGLQLIYQRRTCYGNSSSLFLELQTPMQTVAYEHHAFPQDLDVESFVSYVVPRLQQRYPADLILTLEPEKQNFSTKFVILPCGNIVVNGVVVEKSLKLIDQLVVGEAPRVGKPELDNIVLKFVVHPSFDEHFCATKSDAEKFVDDVCLRSERAFASAKSLHSAFSQWASSNGKAKMSPRAFGVEMTLLFGDSKPKRLQSGLVRCYFGVSL